MQDSSGSTPFIFSERLDALKPVLALLLALLPLYLIVLFYFGGSPRTLNVGYQPEQPVPYSHALHVGELGIDCRYCHHGVETGAAATIPSTQTCMNCHTNILPDSPDLVALRESFATGLPIRWVRVHDLPDYVYFDHSAHVRRGVGCVDCHGRIDRMEVVYQAEPLSMGWCLDCHRQPEPHLRDPARVTDMAWTPDGTFQAHDVEPSEDCSTCHR